MINLPPTRNYIIVKSYKELVKAKQVDLCGYIIWESGCTIRIWERVIGKWVETKYVLFGGKDSSKSEITGHRAYLEFYKYAGANEVEKMKNALSPIDIWDSEEQMHYANFEYAKQKIYKDIYVFDARSSFTYGANQLGGEFDMLKEYLNMHYKLKELAETPEKRAEHKALQNYLIGYFARIKKLIAVRSEIIKESNENIKDKMGKIAKNNGIVYLSNTDSIVTDKAGRDVMVDYLGSEVGCFKLEKTSDRLCYLSPNAYQIGDELKYSGLKYFERKHTNLFEEEYARQEGSLIRPFDFSLDFKNGDYYKICRVEFGQITVTVANALGELIDEFIYKIE